MTRSYRRHRKCSFCGRMLFDGLSGYAGIGDGTERFCNESCRTAQRDGLSGAELLAVLRNGGKPIDATRGIDPITLAVVNGALMSICREMARTMERTAYSPVFSEGADLTTAIFDREFNLVAQYEGIPAQMGSMKYGVVGAIAGVIDDALAPGDVVLHNDSYVGTPHAPEFCMVLPIFVDGDVVAYAANIAHHTDVGGKSPGSMPGDATEIFQEGVIIPPVKVFKRGVADPELWRVYLANVRTPDQTHGDAMAMYASLLTCERRVRELIDRYGRDEFELYCREARTYAERRIRAELASIPDGTYKGTAWLEDDGISDREYAIRCSLTVDGSDILFDFRGTDAQARGPVNSPYGVAVGACANAIFNLVDPTLSHNDGTFAPFSFVLPQGTVVNCNFPAPLNGGNTESHNIIVECIMDALSLAIPERVPAECGSTTCLITGGGTSDDGEAFTYIVWEGSGWGGMADNDGESSITAWVGVGSRTFPAEVLESRYPWRVWRHELRPNPGMGEFRGGLGCEAEYEILCDDFEVSSISCRGRRPPSGRFGGGPGQVAEVRVVRDGRESTPAEIDPSIVCPTKFSGLRLRRGDRLIVRSPGGGGYGEVARRASESLARDREMAYVTTPVGLEGPAR